ncbi:aldehyde dehydrogenase [Mycobacterium sp. 1100029.7]|nr:aldehyde dehydrogenase [Mycobacterium sp. 1100029.7]
MTTGMTINTAALDKALDDLCSGAHSWTALPLTEKVTMLEALPRNIFGVAPQLVAAAVDAKGISPQSIWASEEWATGVWVPIHAINTQLRVLKRMLAGKEPIDAHRVRTRPDGQVIVDVFPQTAYDRLLFHGYRADVWIEPGNSAERTRTDAAAMYRGHTKKLPEVCLVLGAGNMGSITVLDVIEQLYVRGNVCVVKLNPVNDYLGPFYEEIFSDFISRDWLRIVYGGNDVGSYLARHPRVDTIHMTGSAATYDAIVWGTDDRAAARKADNTKLVDKPVTAELGGVTPFIVVPGDWSRADLRFQAEHIATTKLINAGHNCNATQVVVIPREWQLADKLVAEIATAMRDAEPRPSYYPRSEEKTARACDGMTGTEFLCKEKTRAIIPDVDPSSGANILKEEVFGGVLGVVRLPGKTPKQFLHNAVEFANNTLPGSLGAVIAIDPKTRRHNAEALDEAIARLRYGAIGINIWAGMVFALAPWGSYPGNDAQDIGSGVGTVHNAFMLTNVQKAVVEVPFRPAPRSFFGGEFTLSPKPVFFIKNKTTLTTSRRLAKFAAYRRPTALPGILASAVRG